MDYRTLYIEYCETFWRHFLASDLAHDRKGVTFTQWVKRTPAARMAMARYLNDNGAPQKNPFYWVQDFPESEPQNLNGARTLPDEPIVRAIYNGSGGLYTRREAELFNMQILGDFEPWQE